MSVYVDRLMTHPQPPREPGLAQRYFGNGKASCHLTADTLQELHEMAIKLRLKLEWFQAHPRHPHYDLTPKKREQAIRLGAQER